MESENNQINEDGSAAVAYNVPGFDIIFNGHDHRLANEKFVNHWRYCFYTRWWQQGRKDGKADISFTKELRVKGKE